MANALVAGGGIAGPIVAMALQKAGFTPSIYEAYGRTAEKAGAFMNIAPPGLSALECVGVGDAVHEAGFATPAMAFYDHHGRRLTGDVPFDRRTGEGNLTILRADLYVALRDEAERRGIPIEYGRPLVDAVDHGDHVEVEFADGARERADFVVGADGTHSRLRHVVDPQAASPRYLGVLNAWGCLPEYESDEPRGVIRMFFGRKCFFMYTQAHDGELRWYANPRRPVEPAPDELVGGEEFRAELLSLFGRDRCPAAEIIRTSPDIPPPFLNRDLPVLDHWHRGRIVLVGDAAHATSPTSGSGASLAMEDAIVLAQSLRDRPSVPEAFATFEAIRRERVESVVATGKQYIDGNHLGPVMRRVRNAFLTRRFAPARLGDRLPIWVHDYRLEWDRDVETAARARGALSAGPAPTHAGS